MASGCPFRPTYCVQSGLKGFCAQKPWRPSSALATNPSIQPPSMSAMASG